MPFWFFSGGGNATRSVNTTTSLAEEPIGVKSIYTPSAITVLCFLQIFLQSMIEGFSYTYLKVFAGFITGTVIIVATRLQGLSDAHSSALFPFHALLIWIGFALGSLCSGHYGLGKIAFKRSLSQMRAYQLTLSLASILLVAAVISSVFLKINPNDINKISSSATNPLAFLLSFWSGFSFSTLKILRVPDLPLPICTGAVNSLFYDQPHHEIHLYSQTWKRVSLALTIFAGALTGAGTAYATQWATMVLALVVTVINLCLAEWIERRRVGKVLAMELSLANVIAAEAGE
ncbi:MAG: hypothetical protein LQ347_004585 [Umbilicaria vellea]|nr:MAG: hypothetical protein LQ347_004585 [Umbilicaria vellea]